MAARSGRLASADHVSSQGQMRMKSLHVFAHRIGQVPQILVNDSTLLCSDSPRPFTDRVADRPVVCALRRDSGRKSVEWGEQQ